MTRRIKPSTAAYSRTVRYLLLHRLQLERPVTYIDATNLTRRDRRPYIEKSHANKGCRIEALWF